MKNSKLAFGIVLVIILAATFLFFRQPSGNLENEDNAQSAGLADAASCIKAWSDSWRRDLTDAAVFQEMFYPGRLSVGFNGRMSEKEVGAYVAEQGLSIDPDYPEILDQTLVGTRAAQLAVPEGEEIVWICKLTGNRSPLIFQDKDATIVFADPVPLPAALPAM